MLSPLIRSIIVSHMPTRLVVLAAGKSKRMNGGTSKVLLALGDQTIIQYLLTAIRNSGLDPRPVIVVGEHNQEEIKNALGEDYDYVLQREPLGTGHAVQSARETVGSAETVIVLYGDQPFINPETIRGLNQRHKESGAMITMMTTRVPDYSDWRQGFYDFGRIVRGSSGKITDIVERKDASPEELEIKEVNPSFFCFNAAWLWENLGRLKKYNAQGEYYLTDLVHIAVEEGHPIDSIEADPRECIGVNTPEQLDIAKNLLPK